MMGFFTGRASLELGVFEDSCATKLIGLEDVICWSNWRDAGFVDGGGVSAGKNKAEEAVESTDERPGASEATKLALDP